ncbi:MAG: hypothetical protein AABY64_13485 [Bdellovibrionota bacterium]
MIIKTLVLLTSIHFGNLDNSFRKEYYRTYPLRLEQKFRQSFENPGYRLVVRHYSKQDTLWQTLQDPNNTAVFWISHAGNINSPSSLMTGFSNIVDEFGYDLSPAFQGINENLKFLGLIGCSSKKVIEQRAFLPPRTLTNPLKITSFKQEIDAEDGLTKAIEEFKALEKKQMNQVQAQICLKKQVYPIKVKRVIPLNEENLRHPPLRIETRAGKVLGVLPAGFSGDEQSTTVFLDSQSSAENFNLYVNAGNNGAIHKNEISLGNVNFTAGWGNSQSQAQWKVFSHIDGKPMGVTRHYYTFNGVLPSLDQAVSYDSCTGF